MNKFGKWFRLAAKRFLDDLERAKSKSPPFIFDEWYAIDACDFIEELPHVEGEWGTVNVVLHPSHILFVVALFGFRNTDGTRRFTTALFAVARKNAKSFLCSAILLYCLCCEKENGAQVISAATTGSQARIVFNVAKRIVEKVAALRQQFMLESFANAMVRYETGGTFKPINAKASTQDGLNPSHCGIDEVHAHKNHDLLNVLKSAAGARRNPLFFYTTTEGYESPGPWGEIRHYIDGKLNYGNDPVLNWCASNIVAGTDQNMNTVPDKKKSNDKIDDLVVMLMGIGAMLGSESVERSFWEDMA
jgi:phage terminase large subunit-like protein